MLRSGVRLRPPLPRAGRTWALAALTLLTVSVAACGGDDQGAATPTPSSATASATPASLASPVASAVIVSPAVLTSYRYAIALHVAGSALDEASGGTGTPTPPDLSGASFSITITGEVVNPDREHSQTKASLGFIELALERIQIGDRAWTRESGGVWKPATPGASSPAIGGDLDISPTRIFAEGGSAFLALSSELGALSFTPDQVEGLAARRYDLDADQFRAMFGGAPGLLPGDSQPLATRGTLWIAEDSRVPVRIQLTSTDPEGQPAFEMDLTLTDLNDRISIEPPL